MRSFALTLLSQKRKKKKIPLFVKHMKVPHVIFVNIDKANPDNKGFFFTKKCHAAVSREQ